MSKIRNQIHFHIQDVTRNAYITTILWIWVYFFALVLKKVLKCSEIFDIIWTVLSPLNCILRWSPRHRAPLFSRDRVQLLDHQAGNWVAITTAYGCAVHINTGFRGSWILTWWCQESGIKEQDSQVCVCVVGAVPVGIHAWGQGIAPAHPWWKCVRIHFVTAIFLLEKRGIMVFMEVVRSEIYSETQYWFSLLNVWFLCPLLLAEGFTALLCVGCFQRRDREMVRYCVTSLSLRCV